MLAKTPKGQPSTAESVLQELAHEHELPKLILEHRAMSKLKSTYTDALPACVNPGTGRVHTSYHQAVAATGRLSSSDPNLQNIPVRTREGRRSGGSRGAAGGGCRGRRQLGRGALRERRAAMPDLVRRSRWIDGSLNM